jgi:hypothetical protein
MDVAEALGLLGLSAGVTAAEVRATYRRAVRRSHPDVAGDDPAATERTARLTEAYAVLQAALAAAPDGTVAPPGTGADPDGTPARDPAASPPAGGPGTTAPGPPPGPAPADGPGVDAVGADSLVVAAPADEAFAALFDAAGRIGHIAYFDRHLGIVETIVRFEGGPSCSVLVTLQGRAEGTEAFLTMTSIEAAPTPPIAPVVEALVEALTTPG